MKKQSWITILLLVANSCFFSVLVVGQPIWDRPPSEKGPLTVYVAVSLIDIDEIDGAAQKFSANVFFQARWYDPGLKHDGPGNIQLPLEKIWHPQIQLVNQQRVFSTMQEVAQITPDGMVRYRQRVWGDFSQSQNLKNFPLDRQNYNILLASPQSSPDELEMVPDPEFHSLISPNLSQVDWDILDWSAESTIYKIVPDLPGNAAFEFKFLAQRKFGYYLYKIIIPFILVVAMSWTVFWIPPQQSETQISVTVTSMLTLIAFRMSVADMLPRISYFTRLDNFIFFATMMVFLAIIQAVWTAMLAHRGQTELATNIDRWCRWIFPVSFFLVFGWVFLAPFS